jgi:hypothetical protein
MFSEGIQSCYNNVRNNVTIDNQCFIYLKFALYDKSSCLFVGVRPSSR